MTILPEDSDADAVFVERYVEHGDAVRACVEAGISDAKYTINIVAKKQLARAEIQSSIAAIEKLRAAGPRTEVTLDSTVAELQRIFEKAEREGQYNSAISAKKTIAALMGWLTQNLVVTHRHSVADMSDDELERIASQKNAITVPYEEVRGIGHMAGDDGDDSA